MIIYKLNNNFDDFSHFYQLPEYFIDDTFHWDSLLIAKKYKYQMGRSNKNLKNFKLDVSVIMNHLILSDKARKLFEPYGTFFEIETNSKRKKFHGFFPNKCILSSDIADLRISEYEELDSGRLFLKNFFFKKEVENIDLDLFVVEGSPYIYATDRFKEKLEKEGFLGLSFDWLVYDSSREDYIDWKFKIIKEALKTSRWGDIIRSAYKFNDDVTSFESIVENRFLVEEQPFLELYEQYKDDLYERSIEYPTITKYQALCAKNPTLLNDANQLNEFLYFLQESNIFLKTRYRMLCPTFEYFDDGVMINGRFIKNKDLLNGVIKES